MACEIPTHARSPSLGGCFFDETHKQNADSMSQSDASEVSFTLYCLEESRTGNSLFLQSDTCIMQLDEGVNESSDTMDEDDRRERDAEYVSNNLGSSDNTDEEEDDSDSDDETDDATEGSDEDIGVNSELKSTEMTDVGLIGTQINKTGVSTTEQECVRWADIISDSECDDEHMDPLSACPTHFAHKHADEFIDEWDVWYDSPKTNLSKKGMFRDEFEGSLRCLARLRSMKDIYGLFQQFGDKLELIPVDGTVAVCKLGVKPVWEDSSHCEGGRLKIRKFSHDVAEISFRKILNAFVHKKLPFFEYLTCVSLQVKSQVASQKTDVLQIWHSRFPVKTMITRLTKEVRSLLSSEPLGYNAQRLEIYELQNYTAVKRNDVKLCQAGLAPPAAVKPKQIKSNDTSFQTTRNSNKQKLSEQVFKNQLTAYARGTYNGQTASANNKSGAWQQKPRRKKTTRNDEALISDKKSLWRDSQQRPYQRGVGTVPSKSKKSLTHEVLKCDTDTPVATDESQLMRFGSHKWSGEFNEREQYYESRHTKGRGGPFTSYGPKHSMRGSTTKDSGHKKDKKHWCQTDDCNEPSGYYVNGCWYPLPKNKQQ